MRAFQNIVAEVPAESGVFDKAWIHCSRFAGHGTVRSQAPLPRVGSAQLGGSDELWQMVNMSWGQSQPAYVLRDGPPANLSRVLSWVHLCRDRLSPQGTGPASPAHLGLLQSWVTPIQTT